MGYVPFGPPGIRNISSLSCSSIHCNPIPPCLHLQLSGASWVCLKLSNLEIVA